MTAGAFVEALGLPGPPGTRALPEHWQAFLAFDFGTRRTGVASGTRLLGTAQPVGVLHAAEKNARFAAAAEVIAQWQPDALVVGLPFHPDGAPHENTARARQFMRGLHGRFGLPVLGVDERYSTTEARASGTHERQVDAVSAAIILEQFLAALPPRE